LLVVGTYNGTSSFCYVNGKPGSAASPTGNVTTTDLQTTINRSNNTSTDAFRLRQAGIFNRCWSADEVREWTENPTTIFASPDPVRRYFLATSSAAAGQIKTIDGLAIASASRILTP